jgi:hypothetical protein
MTIDLQEKSRAPNAIGLRFPHRKPKQLHMSTKSWRRPQAGKKWTSTPAAGRDNTNQPAKPEDDLLPEARTRQQTLRNRITKAGQTT